MKTPWIYLCVALALITCQQTFGQELLARSSPRIHTPTSLPLRQALKRLEHDYGVSFLVQEIWMDYTVTLPPKHDKSVDEALNALLYPLRLRHHKLRDGFYSITTQTVSFPTSTRSHISTPISGKITTEKGEPLPGVSVIVVGTVQGTITGSDGRYSLTLNPGSYTVRASFVGFETAQRAITVGDAPQEIDFILKESVASLDEVVVLGSRASTARTNIDKPVPVDVIQPKEFKAYAQNDLTQVLNYVAPSFNANRQTVSDGTDHIDPASLRGLGPDQVLVLVNGKRRHTTALVNINGTFGRGTVGTDMNSIPVAAIERVEVLRDGAAAQYGSDAIAGVINLVMKKQSPLTVSTTYGQSWSHALGRDFRDGANRQVDISKGFALGTKGSLNVAGQILDRGYTNRGGLDTRPLLYSSLPTRTATESEADFQARYATLQSADDEKASAAGLDRNNMRVGNADSRNLGLVVNGEYSLGATASVYAMAGYTYKTGKAAGFYRLPSQSSQVDVTLYPNGFLPFINTTIHDGSFIGGVRGELGKWSYDLSHVYGHNDIAFDITNTVNASLPAGTSPTAFYAGKLIFNQNTTNLDLSRKFELSGFLQSLNVAYGAEYRTDHYQIQAGEERSWSFGYPSQGIAGVSGKAAGAQVFPGFRPSNVVDAHRSNTGLYADVEGEMGRVLVGTAARFEHYTDFGSNLSYKVTARWKIYRDLARRGVDGVPGALAAPAFLQQRIDTVCTRATHTGAHGQQQQRHRAPVRRGVAQARDIAVVYTRPGR